MNAQSLVAMVNAPANVLVTLGIFTVIATLSAFLPLRNGNGQHAGAGPGAVDVWRVREYTNAPAPDSSAAGENPPARDARAPESDTDPQPDVYGYRDLYRCRSIIRETPVPEIFDTIGVQLLDAPHSVERTQPVPTIGHCWYAPARATSRETARPAPQPPTTFERLLAQGIRAALDPDPYIGRHRLRTADHVPGRALACAA